MRDMSWVLAPSPEVTSVTSPTTCWRHQVTEALRARGGSATNKPRVLGVEFQASPCELTQVSLNLSRQRLPVLSWLLLACRACFSDSLFSLSPFLCVHPNPLSSLWPWMLGHRKERAAFRTHRASVQTGPAPAPHPRLLRGACLSSLSATNTTPRNGLSGPSTPLLKSLQGLPSHYASQSFWPLSGSLPRGPHAQCPAHRLLPAL